jgi:hypothetical protein
MFADQCIDVGRDRDRSVLVQVPEMSSVRALVPEDDIEVLRAQIEHGGIEARLIENAAMKARRAVLREDFADKIDGPARDIRGRVRKSRIAILSSDRMPTTIEFWLRMPSRVPTPRWKEP